MAVGGPALDYTGVPQASSVDGSGAQSLNIHATPEAFGSQVASAVGNAGKEGFDVAMKQQGMINETLMTNADAALAQKVGEIKGNYLQHTGLAAQAAFPQYQQQLEQARQEARANLPPLAQHGFDMLATRTIANHIADGSTYMASQLRQAQIDSGTSLKNVNVQAVLDSDIAANPERVQYHQDSAIHGLQMTLDENHPGIKVDPETGAANFDESTTAGKALKANYDADKTNIITQVQTNRFETLAKSDPLAAYNTYQQERNSFPRATQVHLDSILAPKVFNAHVDNGTTQVLANAEQEHAKMLYDPQSAEAPKNAIATVLKNEGGLSPDGHAIYGIDKNAHPDEFDLAQQITNERGEEVGQEFAKNFYKKEYWDKNNIQDLPANTQTIVMDGAVNHSADFTNKLISAAKDGATPEQLIDMRREEYQRLAAANPEKYGANLAGWNNRLDNLSKDTGAQTGIPHKPYGTNENGGPLTLADYYRTHSEDVLQKADALAEQQMPGDLAYKRAMRETVSNYMSKTIQNQSAQYVMDNKNLMKAINGGLTNGRPPQTEEDLRKLPGVGDLLDRVYAQDPKFAEGIPTMIAKVSRRNDVTNSPNGYDTVLRTLEPHGSANPNAIASDDHLARLLSRSDGTGINIKDYNDAKSAIELPNPIKENLSKQLQEITNANGNVDGKGQQRALQWYNQVMAAKKTNDAMGEKKIPDDEFFAQVAEKDGPAFTPPTPSRMQQISNWAKEKTGLGHIDVISPDGVRGIIPAGNIEKALKLGYKKVE